jgi:shikimate dehydrogenase
MNTTKVNGETALCLIIGDPVTHSLTPRMHNAGYAAVQLSSDASSQLNYCMTAATVRQADLAQAIAGVRALSIRGLAVTMPHKVAICSMLDVLDPVAKTIGAVNTVVNDGGRLTGYNTDWLGIVRPLERRVSLLGKRVAILGAGGAAQAATYGCVQSGALVTILNRTPAKAREAAAPFKAAWGELCESTEVDPFDIIVNTTPIGMGKLVGQTPIAAHKLKCHQIIFETIYSPRETNLVVEARKLGCEVITGIEMFLEQGAAQFELHTKHVAPRDEMKKVLQ